MIDQEVLDSATGFFTEAFEGVIRIEILDADFSFWVDGRLTPPRITTDSPEAVATHFCLWRVDYLDLTQLFADGGHRVSNSFITGRLRISGDMSVMARLETAS